MRTSHHPWFLRTCLIAVAALMFHGPAHAQFFTGLGSLGTPVFSNAQKTNENGSVVVGVSNNNAGEQRAFHWTSGPGMVDLGVIPGQTPAHNRSNAYGISSDGLVVVGFSNFNSPSPPTPPSSPRQAFRWTSGGGMVNIHPTSGPLTIYNDSVGYGANSNGSVVVGSVENSTTREAFRWTLGGGSQTGGGGTMTGLGTLFVGGSLGSVAHAVSRDGAVVAGTTDTNVLEQQAFRWTSGGGMVALGILPGGTYSWGWHISGDGTTVVGYSENGTSAIQAFRWRSGPGMVGLPYLTGGGLFGSEATATSLNGDYVVGYSDFDDGNTFLAQTAAYWDPLGNAHFIQDELVTAGVTGLAGWQLISATGISEDGTTIVGYGFNPNFEIEAWMVTGYPVAVPEPTTIALGCIGGAGLAYSAWRRRRAAKRAAALAPLPDCMDPTLDVES